MNWKDKHVLITGGASFIGSHLTYELVSRNAKVRVVDNLSSGKITNIKQLIDSKKIEFREADLRDITVSREAVRNVDIVFHLAADHGGRGYIDLHQAACATNFALDGVVIKSAHEERVEKIIFASSGCVYPTSLQENTEEEVYLTEETVTPPYDADNTYGWAKLMAELTLKAYNIDYGLKSVVCRYFTAYGPMCSENHAVMAMIARAYIGQNPYEIWGDGTQIRNWTYINDIVDGTILAAEKIDNASAVNIGTMERISVIDAAKQVCEIFDYQPEFVFLNNMPVGPKNRVADNRLANKLMGWQPKTSFKTGLKQTIDWYRQSKDKSSVKKHLGKLLLERK